MLTSKLSNSSPLASPILTDSREAALLVNEREAARLLGGVCVKTLFNLRRAGELQGVKIGTRIMYDVGELRRFVDLRKG